jgi:hypothetical protein
LQERAEAEALALKELRRKAAALPSSAVLTGRDGAGPTASTQKLASSSSKPGSSASEKKKGAKNCVFSGSADEQPKKSARAVLPEMKGETTASLERKLNDLRSRLTKSKISVKAKTRR